MKKLMSPDAKLDNAIGIIAVQSGQLGINAAEIAGVIHDLVQQSASQTATFAKLSNDVASLGHSNAEIATATQRAAQEVSEMRMSVNSSLERAKALELSVRKVETGLVSMSKVLKSVLSASSEISNIALQTRLVAFNASAEAARAGGAGTAFGVIASAVKTLSDGVQSSSKEISDTVRALADEISHLEASIEAETHQERSSDRSSVIVEAINVFGTAFAQVQQQVTAIQSAVQENNKLCGGITGDVKHLATDVKKANTALGRADARVGNLLSMSEELIRLTAESGAETEDTHYIQHVTAAASSLGQQLEQAIERGGCTMDDLFDRKYLPIPGTNPQQFTTRFCNLTDKLFPAMQEEMLSLSPGIVFCAAVDNNGYLPTHNHKYSQKPRANDPIWNAANCRNRRIFNDRTGLAAGRNTKPFLLQTYRRDMGDGKFAIMKDLSAPILVYGRHWGGLRLAYTSVAH
ncbi:MAG: methyl-accepting chemotaxis protein [Proteobacteria bacterium]|nr:methyl-accepting chemotaxis protein [Pseudomonadota bacterium]